ncbi:hypothetical protein K470DRAFT_246370 [Piedraia hortae CBS 480.64]|uniref:Large ribosomal subunit protein uL23m n=1 Tax=Piedraia hortae CBS 480.64 TaxID=1314780 RepID=A0A6A7C275_9PEZI|nr:hypothetical protein K470DRAFT_246370 [Piedraia hortae CBS 480.64]
MAAAPFRRGLKEIYLPDFVVSLRRTPHLGPNVASFNVPLWFNKLDLRDYLFSVYGIRIGPTIRSYVKQSRVRQGTDPTEPHRYRHWYRPKSTKYMMVNLESPFTWPDEPEDLSPWNREEAKMAQREDEKMRDSLGGMADQIGPDQATRTAMREQAQALLAKKKKWTPAPLRGASPSHYQR